MTIEFIEKNMLTSTYSNTQTHKLEIKRTFPHEKKSYDLPKTLLPSLSHLLQTNLLAN